MAISDNQWQNMAQSTRDRLLQSGYEQRPSGAWGEGGVYAQSPNVNWTYGGQSTTTPLNRQSFLTEGAARNLGSQLGSGFNPYGMQLGGPAAYSTPMQMFGQQNAGLAQDQLDRGMSIDQLRDQLNRERQMAQGTAIDPSRQMADGTLNRSAAQSQSEALYRAQGLVQGADGQWRTPQNAQQASPAPPQAQPSAAQQRYGPMASQMRQQQVDNAMRGGGPQQQYGPQNDPRGYYNPNNQFLPSNNPYGGGLAALTPNPNYNGGQSSDRTQYGLGEYGPGDGQMNPRALQMLRNGYPQSQPSFQNAMFGQRMSQYGGSPYATGSYGSALPGRPSGDQDLGNRGYGQPQGGGSYGNYGGQGSAFPSLQRVRSGQANSLGYDPYYYSDAGPQRPQARQQGWIYPQNTGAFQLRGHGSQESNAMSGMQQDQAAREQASMPAAWRTAQQGGRGAADSSWDFNQGARSW